MPNAALRPLLRIDADIGPMTPIGATPAGEIVLVPILGGSFEGDDVRGEVLSGGADWQGVRRDSALAGETGSDRALEISARYLLKSDLGELIGHRLCGALVREEGGKQKDGEGKEPAPIA